MKQAFAIGWGISFSVGRFRRNLLFYKDVKITNALRSQFDYERYGKLPEKKPTISVKVIEGRGR
ncbi:hypothetical protein [Pelodictyon phaeoclathratiforme]|jgi:hypothetical protein|uniref:Uncharacterized protein n=1 Tax=Pelodictyon phaeoclathratiforme (strain DSM 5477 / BU-1) TaxID=324925 RepID=B4SA11_PELPB|nr:hypothetical protein [Pelodictyon phaeoclathratiforme]ACF43707.1 hypothetical protein Ppha_1453 [Pelodictyon phaeoclathratiforme BU-1]MBV5330646.1 hypothetical protein [Chlorobium sp.]